MLPNRRGKNGRRKLEADAVLVKMVMIAQASLEKGLLLRWPRQRPYPHEASTQKEKSRLAIRTQSHASPSMPLHSI